MEENDVSDPSVQIVLLEGILGFAFFGIFLFCLSSLLLKYQLTNSKRNYGMRVLNS